MESPAKRSKESKKGRSVLDLNNIEHVNAQLKGKVKLLTAEMKDAVERMNSMTLEMNTIRNENLLYKDRLGELEQENALLISQIEEMVNERAERDAIIEEFGTAVEARIVEWKEILDEKDSVIAKLKENLLYAANDRYTNPSQDEKNHIEIERLIQDIDRRDEIIAELQTKLSEAVVEINESSLLIEKFKSDTKTKDNSKRNNKNEREVNKKFQDVAKKINTLENSLERAERDAKVKSEQLCEALAILNKYEDENASLTEALEEIKKLKDQIEKKNEHIEDLVGVINKLETENSRFEEAIIILREKLGIVKDEEFPIEDLILQRREAQEEKFQEIQRNFDELSSQNVDLKFQIRKLKSTLKESLKSKLTKTNGISSDGENVEDLTHRSESKKEHVELLRIQENFKWIIEENEALRQGMQEILDCIHNQDGKSIVTIQSQTLENLLDALDARHVAGWYHPAMRLQGRVNYLQGNNAELRAQLQQIRRNQMMLEVEAQQRSSSVEEGECSQRGRITPDGKTEIQVTPTHSRNMTPKSMGSSQSQNLDSGRASGKAGDMDEMQQETEIIENENRSVPYGDTQLDDEGFGKKSEEIYAMAKEIIAQESDFKKALNDSEKRQKVLESQIITLRKNFANFISPDVYNELRVKYLESNMRLRIALEDRFTISDIGDEIKDIEAIKNKAMQELRDELISLHKQLSQLTTNSTINKDDINMKIVTELENRIVELTMENEKLKKSAKIANEEALVHRAIDSTVLTEFNDLRQRLLKLDVVEGQEVRETARLSFELANYKVIETELREKKKLLESELSQVRNELAELKIRQESERDIIEQSRKQINNINYIEIIDFLQNEYAGSTSLSAWERYNASLNKLNSDRSEVKDLITKINYQNENLKIQHETLTSRLQIVERLKDMLEQQIGSNDVQDIMLKFTNVTKPLLSESKYKMQISQLEEEIKKANANLSDYEAKIESMEQEMNKAQKAWKVQKISNFKRPASLDKVTETEKIKESVVIKQLETKYSQTKLEMQSIEIQCKLYDDFAFTEVSKDDKANEEQKDKTDESGIDDVAKESDDEISLQANIALLQEQLGQALALASERSVALSKSESQLAEYRTKNAALTKLLDEKTNATIVNHEDTSQKNQEDGEESEQQSCVTSQEALESTIKTLQKIISQKEETIARYQNLLKEDRDKHSEAAGRLQEEIKNLKRQIRMSRSPAFTADNALIANNECPERDLAVGEAETGKNDERTEEMSILKEKISRLETELSISAELAERWHRLAEDRLRHMDSMRERLEEQHREEIDSYRTELNNRQYEIDQLRREVSESRRAPTNKTEVLSFMKALQIKDNRLADEIENELEEHAAVASQQLSTTYSVENSRRFEYEQLMSQLDNLKRQLQVSKEREKLSKNEITDLQQQLSRKYMAVKTQEKKASKREMQLERKVKELEEELHEAKEMLERHFMVQQAKRAKTAEDLGLWEKLKKWQQTAEKLKEKLKEKTDECQRLQNNYEKLRTLISCMEREKWYLRGKYRSESVSVPAWIPTTDVLHNNDALVQDLQRECEELRERVKELVGRLNLEESHKIDEKKTAASIAFEGDEFLNEELKRLKSIQELLEKENLKLEAENFELRLKLERANVNTPRYEEKIQHLEKYIDLLKSEKTESSYSKLPPKREGTQRTKTELERTVVTLKRLVEKLQQENKNLRSSITQSDLDSQCNCIYLREEHEKALQRIARLEMELELAEKRLALMEETAIEKSDDDGNSTVAVLRQQLSRKSELLSKVKDLLAKAVLNEKELRQRIQQLEFKQTLSMIPECGTSLAMT